MRVRGSGQPLLLSATVASRHATNSATPAACTVLQRIRLLIPERDVDEDHTIFSSLGADPLVKITSDVADVHVEQTIFSSSQADPLVKTTLVVAVQSTVRSLSFWNSPSLKVIMFWVSLSPCSSDVLTIASMAIVCFPLLNDDSNVSFFFLLLLLIRNSTSPKFLRPSTPETDSMLVRDKAIFSSIQAASSSKLILVKLDPSTRRYLRHLNSSFLKSSDSMSVMRQSLMNCNLGSLARSSRLFLFSEVLLKVTLTRLLLASLMNNGRNPFCVVPLMLRLSRSLG